MAAPETGSWGARELDVLRAASRTHSDHTHLARLDHLLAGELDWPTLVEAAEFHGVTPLLWWTVSREAVGGIPEDRWEYLRDFFVRNAAHGLYMQHELVRLLHLLRASGLRAVTARPEAVAGGA